MANALVVVAVEGKALDEAHYKNAPRCLVDCLGQWEVLEYPKVCLLWVLLVAFG